MAVEYWTYEQFLAYMKGEWKQGEHIGVIGPTGAGKTWIVRDLLLLRRYSVVIATKEKDKTLVKYEKEDGFQLYDTWPPFYQDTRVLLWKKPKELGNFYDQAVLVYQVMSDIYKRGGWTVSFDDIYYVSNTLRLKGAVQMFYTQVRSNNVSILGNMQRPSWVPLEAVSQVSYIIMFITRDKRDLARIAEGAGLDLDEVKAANGELLKHEFLLLQTGKNPVRVAKSERK